MKKSFRIYINAPITLAFCLMCLFSLLLAYITNNNSTYLLFSTYSSNLFDPLTYVRLFMHVFGHANFEHLISNLLYILLLGPMLEEKYHDRLIIVILSTAIITGVIHNILDPNTCLLGASGIVFAFILLSSVTGKSNGIPITTILVAILYLGNEIITGINDADSVSQLTHIIGGISGCVMGLIFKKRG